MHRIIICTDEAFPRGSAGANYLLYFAKALIDIDYTPIIIAYTENADGLAGQMQSFENVSYILVEPPCGKLQHFYTFNMGLHHLYLSILQQLKPTQRDILWLYTAELPLIRGVRRYAAARGLTLGACVVEWYTAYPSESITEKWKYHRYKKVYKKEFTKIQNLLPISSWLNDYYSKFNVHTMVLPMMTEVKPLKRTFKPSEKLQFIYPGGKSNKDDIAMLLAALSETGKNYKYEIHLTGINQDREVFLSQYPKEVQQEMRKHLLLHGWLSYDELENLYYEMDFLVLLRQKSETTLANFPSKIPETMGYGIIPIVNNIGDYGTLLYKAFNKELLLEQYSEVECIKCLQKVFRMQPKDITQLKNNVYQIASDKFDYHNFESRLRVYFHDISE